MNRYLRAALLSLPYLVFFVLFPYLILVHVIPKIETQAKLYSNIDPDFLLTGVMAFGLALAAFSAVQGWAYKWSVFKPIGMVARRVTSYVLLLFLMGVGNPWTFGLTNVILYLGRLSPSLGSATGDTVSVTVISTIFALLLGTALVLKLTQDIMKYAEDKRGHLEASQGLVPV